MAEFCNQCAADHGFAAGDFKGIGNPADLPLKPGEGFPVICEGCGFVLVDNEGNCLGGAECMESHHERKSTPDPKTPDYQDRMRDRQRFTREQHRARDGTEPPRAEPLGGR
jgi:hypothetical protein